LTALAQGDREVAGTEWRSNEIKTKALIETETKQAVAAIGQKLKEVQGQTLSKVAMVQTKTQECLYSIAETGAKTTENNRKATQIAAKAQEKNPARWRDIGSLESFVENPTATNRGNCKGSHRDSGSEHGHHVGERSTARNVSSDSRFTDHSTA